LSRKHLAWVVAALALILAPGAVARGAGAPDLLITTMSTPPKVTGPGNDGFTLVGVVNYGGALAPRSKGKMLLSKDTRPSRSDRVLKQFRVKALPSHGSVSVSVVYTMPAEYGSWHLIACVDVTYVVRESNERNNCRASTSKMTIGHNPPMPVVTTVTPASPSRLAPTVHGTGPPGDYILVYTNATCSGMYVSNSNKVGSSGTWAVPLNLRADGTYVIHARTHSTLTGQSACSTTFATFTRDTTAPPAPTDLAITGGGAGSDTTPTITGTTEPGATVKVFSDQNLSTGACQTLLGAAVADGGGQFAWDEPIPLSSPDDTYRTYHVLAEDEAGNHSSCSLMLDYLLS
jgi:CARDB protein/Big-like domain-containing protein